MKKETKISILGAGAIGCTLVARLILAGCERVSLIARGDNFQVLSKQGIHLKDLTGEYQLTPYRVVQDIAELEPQDLIFIATKSKPVDIGLQPFTKGDKRQRKMRRLPQIFTRFTTDDNG